MLFARPLGTACSDCASDDTDCWTTCSLPSSTPSAAGGDPTAYGPPAPPGSYFTPTGQTIVPSSANQAAYSAASQSPPGASVWSTIAAGIAGGAAALIPGLGPAAAAGAGAGAKGLLMPPPPTPWYQNPLYIGLIAVGVIGVGATAYALTR